MEESLKIVYQKPRVSSGVLKCAVHFNGRLGWSKSAAEFMGLETGKYVKIGINLNDTKDTSLYLEVLDFSDEETFKVYKAGQYYYLKTKELFLDLSLDFRRKSIIYDISDFKYKGKRVFRLYRRMKDRKEQR